MLGAAAATGGRRALLMAAGCKGGTGVLAGRSSCRSLVGARALSSSSDSDKGSQVQELANIDEYQKSSRDKAVMYFTARWCPPCRRIAPLYQELAGKTTDVNFYKVDIDVNRAAAKEAGIMSVPTFIFYKDGQVISKFAGADYELLEDTVEQLRQ